ncbi:hypothetical protein WN55_00508 [Dufourea novaeangliae]|uniref:Torsin-1A-interacting protein 1 n=1 Tax=Dufourea novaeangliae TaxID=178035 RepID=A0A154PDD9_DUFNO|nr:hypothetical protein WN55_00508 [Dufourea novaeangliae]
MRTVCDIKEQTKNFLDHANDDDYSDDEDDYSDDVDDYSDDANNKSLNNLSQSFTPECPFSSTRNSSLTTQVRERSFQSINTSRSFNITSTSLSSYSQVPIVQSQSKKIDKNYNNLFCTSLAIIIVLCIFFYILIHNEATQSETSNIDLVTIDKLLDERMHIVQTQFNHQKSNIWNDIASGIYDAVLYPEKPTVITLFGNEIDTLNCLAQMLGEVSGTILGSNDYLSLTPKDFPNDVGETIYNFKVKISQKRVVIIQDLLSINTEAIKAFHNFCDRQRPLIKKAIYIITIIIDEYKPSQSELEFIDKQIFKKLSGKIDKDILDPLVTRLTDGVIVPVLPESSTRFNMKKCLVSKYNRL